jgi:plastocyanin
MRRLIPAALISLALVFTAGAAAATTAVKITDTAFSPKNVTVAFGDTVKWTNDGKENHQLVADNGTFASAVLKPGATYSFTFKAAGTFNYHDALHPTLKGQIKVTGPPPSVTLGAGSPILVYGQQTTITGTVSNGAANEPVIITARPYGAATVQQVATVTTGAGGGFSYTATPSILTTYTATWKTASSQPVTIQVRPHITFLPYTNGEFITKAIGPSSFAGRTVYLQRLSAFGQWVSVKKLILGSSSGRAFRLPTFHGTATFHVYMSVNSAGAGYLDGWSGTQRVHRR